MRFSIICGSQRTGSQSLAVSELIAWRLQDHAEVSVCDIVPLTESNIPLWDDSFPLETEAWSSVYDETEVKIVSSDAIIACVPEYGGMVPPVMKNLFLLDRKRIFAHKPGLIISISEGLGGSYPISELRMSSYKNSKICWIPEQIVLRRVGQLTQATQQARDDNRSVPKSWDRIDHSLQVLIAYGRAMSQMRRDTSIDLDRYPNGM